MRGWVLRPGRRSYHNPLSIREGKGKGGQQGLEVERGWDIRPERTGDQLVARFFNLIRVAFPIVPSRGGASHYSKARMDLCS